MIMRNLRPRRLSTSNMSLSSPIGGGLPPPGGYVASDGLLTPTSATEHTSLLPDPFPRNHKEEAPKGFLNRLFSFFRTFWLPKIEVEGPEDDQLPSITDATRGSSLVSRIQNMFNELTSFITS
jgi:hypothetical protein